MVSVLFALSSLRSLMNSCNYPVF